MQRDESWRPTASTAKLRLRAGLLKKLRTFFEARGVLEVETPALSYAGATDRHLASFRVQQTRSVDLYLQTSPEFHMKRLLAAGSGDIYQLCKVFRDGETGRRHNTEFTLLEWYRLGFDHHRLMREVAELVSWLVPIADAEPEYLSYREAFERYAGFNPFSSVPAECRDALQQHGITPPAVDLDYDGWLDFTAATLVYPALGEAGITFIYDYPASQAALACIRNDAPPVAERFEAFLDGMELANGFHELADAEEQRQRFDQDLKLRAVQGLPAVPMDEHLLAALQSGLPPCAGVALGFDRLVMLAANVGTIDEVITFPIERA
ncbi:MAG TPA: EF-P lysine aminoacylase EpmA [Gammaproteobacteria bacterium]|nr:EF-P lysine aminoacylase EpmA [Gammaproteobacteria bacterium]